MKATRILHASVNVQGSLDATTAFYAELLSLPSADRPVIPGVDGHWFAVGDAQLHLVDAPCSGAPAIDPTGPHLCVGVDDLDAAIAELDQREVRWAGEIIESEWYRYRGLHDPEGNLVYLTEPLLDRRDPHVPAPGEG
jgi:catechol 2,3-dioxygenase-like lactoylglutathione lyase family enzyme